LCNVAFAAASTSPKPAGSLVLSESRRVLCPEQCVQLPRSAAPVLLNVDFDVDRAVCVSTPVVRSKAHLTIRRDVEVWKVWIEQPDFVSRDRRV
jgi:hypothetical protein